MNMEEDLSAQAGEIAEATKAILEGLKEVHESENRAVWTSGDMCTHLRHGSGIDGLGRLIKKVEGEMMFARSMANNEVESTLARVKSSNLGVYEGVLKVLQEEVGGVVGVQRTFSNEEKLCVEVDVVAGNGSTWIKVKSMNNRNMKDVLQGKGRYGERSVIELAADMMEVAEANPVNFGVANCFIVFMVDIDMSTRKAMELSGVRTLLIDEIHEITTAHKSLSPEEQALKELAEELGEGMDEDDEPSDESSSGMALNPLYVQSVNLDVTALFALTSDLTNGNNMYDFPSHKVLNGQAVDDRKRPVLPVLTAYLAGKRILICETALREFQNIIKQVAGPDETQRAEELLKRCVIVADQPTEKSLKLVESGRIKQRQKAIFGTGDYHRAVTITANVQFVQAAIDQNAGFTVFVHAARALTERKRHKDGVHTDSVGCDS